MNRAEVIGNLGSDPDVRKLDNGTSVATISVATHERWKSKDGEKHEHTEWHRVVLWGGLAEIAGEYLKTGSKVFIAGTLRTRKYDDKKGVTRYTTEIVARELEMLGDASGGGRRPPHPAEREMEGTEPPPFDGNAPGDDAIPF